MQNKISSFLKLSTPSHDKNDQYVNLTSEVVLFLFFLISIRFVGQDIHIYLCKKSFIISHQYSPDCKYYHELFLV